MTKSIMTAAVATLLGPALLAGVSRAAPDPPAARADRPPVTLHGAWSYSNSDSRDGSSWSEALAVRQSQADPGRADVRVQEMANGVTHTARQDRVRYRDVVGVLDRLVARAKRGL